MEDSRFYVHFQNISVIRGRWKGDNERLYITGPRLRMKVFLPSAGFKSDTAKLVVSHHLIYSATGLLYAHWEGLVDWLFWGLTAL